MAHQGVFVSASGHLSNRPGGAQQCTSEYLATLRAAGIDLDLCQYGLDKRLSTRMVRKFWPTPYFRLAEQGLIGRIHTMVQKCDAKFVFLNQVQLAWVAAPLRNLMKSECQIVVLSHGLESTDLLHALTANHDLPLARPSYLLSKYLLGSTLLREQSYRSVLDLVLCLSPFDVELERWLGARRAEWVPRTIASAPLGWNPNGNRVGFVGTLDHTPNIEGLWVFLRALSAKRAMRIRVRVVGGPDRIGQRLMQEFPYVDYLGALSDDSLREEASSWNCFAHPIFCFPRGCSTKLATAIGWQIPIVTTTPGHRGYQWGRGSLSVADNPDEFAELCLKMMDPEFARRARTEIADVAQSSPSINSVGQMLASLLLTANRDRQSDSVCRTGFRELPAS